MLKFFLFFGTPVYIGHRLAAAALWVCLCCYLWHYFAKRPKEESHGDELRLTRE